MPFPDVPAGLDAQFARAARRAPAYVGQLVAAARVQARDDGIQDVRVLSLDGKSLRMHQDHRPNRFNLLVLNGKVVRAAFF